MRSYAKNSSEAAARLLAIVLVSDGHVCRSEMEAVQALDLTRRIGLAPGAFAGIVQALCEDLLVAGSHGQPLLSAIDEPTMAALAAEVDDPELRRTIVQLAVALVGADGHVAADESAALEVVRSHWRVGDAGADAVAHVREVTRRAQPPTAARSR